MLKFSESSDIISINGKKKREIKLGDYKMIKKRRVFKHLLSDDHQNRFSETTRWHIRAQPSTNIFL